MFFESWALALMVGFILGCLLDGIFLYRGKRHTALILIGYVFFTISFFIINLLINTIPFIFKLIKSKKFKWVQYLTVPEKGRTLEAGESIIIYLVEIVFSFVVGGIITFQHLESFINSGDNLLGVLILIGTVFSFFVLVLNKLPYPRKFRIPKIILYSLIIIIIIYVFFAYFIHLF